MLRFLHPIVLTAVLTAVLAQVKSPGELDGYYLGPVAPDADTVSLVSRLITTFGGVPVSAKNMFQLLKGGEHVLLYPGGVREVKCLQGTNDFGLAMSILSRP